MPEHFEVFNQFINKHVKFTEAELVDLNQKCTKVHFSKGALIMKAGEVQNNLYFITKGIIRNYVEDKKGQIKIYNFRSEYMTVTGYALYNYEENMKALVNVECLEDCIMIEVPIAVINYVVNNMKLGDRLCRFMAEVHVVKMLHYVLEKDTKTIIERLDSLAKDFPNINNRIPQYMIASYLGITPVHLSNLKKRRKTALGITNIN
jgi:CRP-like cAMP-binding protein